MRPLSKQETHDQWATRLKTKGKDCEFDKMNVKEAIKLVITLHTPLPKLQTAIIRDDMTFDQMMKMAQSMELAQREVSYMQQTAMTPTQTYNAQETMDFNQMSRHTDRQGRAATTTYHIQRKHHMFKSNKNSRIMQILWRNRTSQRQLQSKRSHMSQLWKDEPLCKSIHVKVQKSKNYIPSQWIEISKTHKYHHINMVAHKYNWMQSSMQTHQTHSNTHQHLSTSPFKSVTL